MENINEPGREKSLSQTFDEIYEKFQLLTSDRDATPTAHPLGEDGLHKTIRALEYVTENVSALDMFSGNENYKEMDPRHLKFLLLPYMLGTLWQLTVGERRKDVCRICQVYFTDFLKRCIQYEFVKGSHQVPEGEEIMDEKGNKLVKTSGIKLNSDEKRRLKIKKFKENKELEEKIVAYRKFAAKYDEDDATTYSLEIYEAVIKRAINDSEDQLESIEMEIGLIKYHDEQIEGGETSSMASSLPPPRAPLKPFIITKDATQKAVYGMGYPSLPIMTVEELYQQRRETGEWGPPPTGTNIPGNPEDDADQEARVKELLEEQDDGDEIARKRANDEYKDDHRRGWGNRFNRS